MIRTAIEGLLIVEPRIFSDDRGLFLETWQQQRYAQVGIEDVFVQDNLSRSRRDVLRGLHFQKRNPQGKLVSVSRGAVWDVAVDLRVGSPTFGQWAGLRLSEENRKQTYIPPGFAHGFCVLTDEADFHYKCTDYYHPEDEGGLRWDDPALRIEWPVTTPVLNEKDAGLPLLNDLGPEDLPAIRYGA